MRNCQIKSELLNQTGLVGVFLPGLFGLEVTVINRRYQFNSVLLFLLIS